jgi:hypothetical protein
LPKVEYVSLPFNDLTNCSPDDTITVSPDCLRPSRIDLTDVDG